MCQVASGSRPQPANRKIVSSKINQLLFMLDLDPALEKGWSTVLKSITLRTESQAFDRYGRYGMKALNQDTGPAE
jgi:hypothetical protein